MTTLHNETQKRYTKGAARRDSIIAEAEAMFAELGFNQPTMIDIAARCGISRGGLLRYFPSKESLLVAVLERRGMMPPAEATAASTAVPNTSDLTGIWEERGRKFDSLLDLRVVDGDLGGALRELMVDNASDRKYLELFVTLSAEATNPDHPAHEFFSNHYRIVDDWVLRHVEEFLAAEPASTASDAVTASGLAASIIAVMDGLQVRALYNPAFDIVSAFDVFLVSVGLLDRPD